jgi:hypothetical protein
MLIVCGKPYLTVSVYEVAQTGLGKSGWLGIRARNKDNIERN